MIVGAVSNVWLVKGGSEEDLVGDVVMTRHS